jgi:hypothetical protein
VRWVPKRHCSKKLPTQLNLFIIAMSCVVTSCGATTSDRACCNNTKVDNSRKLSKRGRKTARGATFVRFDDGSSSISKQGAPFLTDRCLNSKCFIKPILALQSQRAVRQTLSCSRFGELRQCERTASDLFQCLGRKDWDVHRVACFFFVNKMKLPLLSFLTSIPFAPTSSSLPLLLASAYKPKTILRRVERIETAIFFKQTRAHSFFFFLTIQNTVMHDQSFQNTLKPAAAAYCNCKNRKP